MDKISKLVPQKIKNKFLHFPKGVIANLRYRFPSKGMIVIGITGTDGKTTTTNMIYQILRNAGKSVSMISTLGAVISKKELNISEEHETGFHVTTLSPIDLQRYLSLAKKSGSEYLVLEVTSQGLDQFRVLGVKFQIGVITNITQDHFDYHKNFENYFQTKAKLIKNVRVAVLNRDEKHFDKLSKLTKGKVVSFGLGKNADFNPLKFPIKLKLPGEYNLANAMAAAGACYSLGISADVIKNSLFDFKALNGRMEEVENKLGIKIIVDFAHTPNALEQALKTLKKQTVGKGKLIAVFGSAGDRDKLKRPLMGEAVSKYADKIILTAEDPRSEGINQIIDEIAGGIKMTDQYLYKEPDRKKAIEQALEMGQKGDIIGVFGKGHEKAMNYGKGEIPWSDRDVIEEILNGRKN